MNDSIPDSSLLELYDDAPCGFLITRLDGVVVQANRTLLEWIGRAADDLVGIRRFQDLLTVASRIFYENRVSPLLHLSGSVREVAFDVACPDREPMPVLVSSMRRPAANGNAALVASIVFDATERRGYERELLRARRDAEQLAAVVAASTDAILSTSPSGEVQAWNPGATRLYGWTAAEMVGRTETAVVPPGRLAEAANIRRRLAQGERIEGLHTVRVAKDGRRIDVSVSAAPVFDAAGTVIACASVARDVTEQRRTEARIRAAEAAEEASRLRSAFLRTMTHELRTPLHAVLGYAELLRDGLMARGLSDEAADAEQIMRSGEQLLALVDDVLDLARLQAGGLELDQEPVDLAAAVGEVVSALAHEAATKGISVTADIPAGLAVQADRRRLGQVLLGLVGNAVKFTERGSVIISAEAEGAAVAVAVADTGVGFPDDMLARIFEEFRQADESPTRRHGGSGLGLAITKHLVELHGGTISAKSTPGKGSSFTFTLPAA
jgi:PAS domain S-box-containing protein